MNYRNLLKKYIIHVGRCEGISFLEFGYFPPARDDDRKLFTSEDVAELQKLDKETLEEQRA